MSSYPFFPTLQPQVCNGVWFEKKYYSYEEAEVLYFERENQKFLDSIKNSASDILPIGKVHNINTAETDDEDANEDSDESDSRDEEDEDANDRPIPGQPERSALYSPGEDVTPNDEASVTMGENSQ